MRSRPQEIFRRQRRDGVHGRLGHQPRRHRQARGSGALVESRARTIEQMRLINALCRFAEMAEVSDPGH